MQEYASIYLQILADSCTFLRFCIYTDLVEKRDKCSKHCDCGLPHHVDRAGVGSDGVLSGDCNPQSDWSFLSQPSSSQYLDNPSSTTQ